MANYSYKAKNLAGEYLEGVIEANSRDEIDYALRDKGYFVVDATRQGSEFTLGGLFGSVSVKDLAVFCRQFSVMINSGITIVESIGTLSEQVEKKKLKDALDVIHGDIQKGRLLSTSMELYPEIFPNFMRNMVKVGEASGSLDDILNRLADYYEHDAKIRRKIRTALTYPAILGVMTVGLVVLLMVKILPMFNDILNSTGGEMPLLTVVLMAMSDFMVNNALGLIISIFLVVIGITYFKKTESGTYWFDSIKLNLPVIKKSVIKVITARFARSLGILLKSGITIINAMDIIGDLIGNVVVEERFQSAKEEIKEGRGIAGPLKRLGLFPPLLIHMVTVGENTGELDEMLARTAGFFDEEVDEAIDKLTGMIEPVMIIIMAVVVGTIILSIMLPMISVLSSVQ